MSKFKSQNIVCSSNHKILFVMRFFFLCFQSVSPLFWFAFCVNIALFESSNQKRIRDKPRFSVG